MSFVKNDSLKSPNPSAMFWNCVVSFSYTQRKRNNSSYLQSCTEHFYLLWTKTGTHLIHIIHMKSIHMSIHHSRAQIKDGITVISFLRKTLNNKDNTAETCCSQGQCVTFYQKFRKAPRQSATTESLSFSFVLFFLSLFLFPACCLNHSIFFGTCSLTAHHSLQAVEKHTYQCCHFMNAKVLMG